MTSIYPIDQYDKDGNLTGIEFLDKITHEFQFQALWDDREEQTQKNREEFRKWANNMAKNMGFDVCV